MQKQRRAPIPGAAHLPPVDPAPIEIDRLCAFLQGPVKALLGRRIGLWLRDDEDPVRDERPLDLDGLEQWRVGDGLLNLLLRDQGATPQPQVFQAFRVSGQLPPGPPGQELFVRIEGKVRAVLDRVLAVRAGSGFPPIDVDLVVPGACFGADAPDVRLVGRIADLYPGGRVHHQYSRVQAKHVLAAWVRHLVLHIHTGAGGESFIVGRPDRGNGVRLARLGPLPVAEAQDNLVRLLQLYQAGQRAALPFFPASSRAWMEKRANADAARRAVENAWSNDRDAYVDRAFGLGETTPLSSTLRAGFIELAERVWSPVFAAEARR